MQDQGEMNTQSDHDAVVRLEVMVQSIIASQTRLEQQLKDFIASNNATFAAWDAKTTIIHSDLDKRIRAIEDLAAKYIPLADDHAKRITENENNIQILRDDGNKFLGGWKTGIFLGGILAGTLGLIISIVDIYVHINVK